VNDSLPRCSATAGPVGRATVASPQPSSGCASGVRDASAHSRPCAPARLGAVGSATEECADDAHFERSAGSLTVGSTFTTSTPATSSGRSSVGASSAEPCDSEARFRSTRSAAGCRTRAGRVAARKRWTAAYAAFAFAVAPRDSRQQLRAAKSPDRSNYCSSPVDDVAHFCLSGPGTKHQRGGSSVASSSASSFANQPARQA
jgi:hypothetical protein